MSFYKGFLCEQGACEVNFIVNIAYLFFCLIQLVTVYKIFCLDSILPVSLLKISH